MTSHIIVDSSPLIVLLKSDLEFVLPLLFDEVIVPESVWNEIVAGEENDIARRKLPHTSWLKIESPASIPSAVTTFDLGSGESHALSIALVKPGSRVLLDDAAARRAARSLNTQLIGTGGLLILAYRKGLIESFEKALDSVVSSGLWLSPEIIQLLRNQAKG